MVEMVRGRRVSVALIGAFAIAAGLTVYAVFRPVRIPLIPPALHLAAGQPHPSVVLGAVPSFLHALAMPLLTAAGLRRLECRHIVIASLVWCAVDLAFEVGQRSQIGFLPAGVFDPLDLLGVLLGAALAAAVGIAMLRSTP
jgi:hypothetical protein